MVTKAPENKSMLKNHNTFVCMKQRHGLWKDISEIQLKTSLFVLEENWNGLAGESCVQLIFETKGRTHPL